MGIIRPISDYALFNVNIKTAEEAHSLVTEFRESLLTDHALQNVLLNRGYELDEDERPRSYFDLGDATWARKNVILHLMYLGQTIELATRPQIACVSIPNVLFPDENGVFPEAKANTPGGLDYARIEQLQEQWMRNIDVVEKIREYKRLLDESFGEFNLKLVLSRAYNSRNHIYFGEEEAAESRYFGLMQSVISPEAFVALDSAYYDMANRIAQSTGNLWKSLWESEFGRNFVLSAEESLAGMRRK